MESKKIKNNTQLVIYALVILGLLGVVNYISTKVFVRSDLTEQKVYSVSKATKTILRNLDDIVSIKVYFSKNLPANVRPLEADVHDMLSEYKAYAGKNLRITYEDPTKSEEEKRKVVQMGIPELQMQSYEKDKAQVINGFMGIAVLYGDKKELMPVVQDVKNLEYDLTQAILKVGRKEIPRIGILKTDTMPSIPPQMRQRMPQSAPDFRDKYKPIFDNLEKNYDVSVVEANKGQPIDTTLRTLVIPGGKDFSNRTLFEIDQYFMKGGKLVVLADAIDINLQYGANAMPQDPGILKLVEHYGAKIEHSLICDAACGQVQIPQKVGPFQMNVAVNYPYFLRVIREGLNQDNPAVSTLGEIVFPWISPITLLVPETSKKGGTDSGAVKATVLIKSSKKSWVVSGNFDLNPQQKWAEPAKGFTQSNLAVALSGNFKSYFAGQPVPPVNDVAPNAPDSVKQLAAIPSPADANRIVAQANKNGHIVVIGESDFITPQFGMPGNVTLVLNLVDWFSSDNNLISIRSRTMADRTLSKDNLKEGSSKTAIIRYVNVLLMPILVVCFGLFLFIKRREKTGVAVSTSDKTQGKV